jgi:carbon storage regulator CsrA
MLKLTQRPGESVVITLPDGRLIKVTCWEVRGNQVLIGYDAPREIVIDREAIWRRKQRQGGEPDGNV